MELTAYRLDGHSPSRHLALETLLMEECPAKRGILLFYVNEPCVIIGRNQNPWREVPWDAEVLLLRRASGGGAVYHDTGNLNWAFIVPRASHDRDRELSLLCEALDWLGFSAEPGERGGLYLSDPPHAGRKISGTARRFGPEAVLHHGTLLVSADLDALEANLGGFRTIEDRSLASVRARPINLADVAKGADVWAVAGGLAARLTGKGLEPLPAGVVDAAQLAEEQGRLESDEWIFGETPPFSIELGGVAMRIERGRITGMEGGAPDGTGAGQGAAGMEFRAWLASWAEANGSSRPGRPARVREVR